MIIRAILLHNTGVPCVAKVIKKNKYPLKVDTNLYLNPSAIVRYEPNGAVITPPTLYSSFIHVDRELTERLKQHKINIKGLPKDSISLLRKSNVLLDNPPPEGKVFRETEVTIPGLPTRVLLDVTSDCNCNCIACYHKVDIEEHTPPLKELCKNIKKLKELGLGLFEVTGGEPLLREDLDEILEYIINLGLHFYIVTNGEYLKDLGPRLISVLKKGLGVAVSFDGVGSVHDKIRRRPGLYDKVIKGLNKIHYEGIKIYLISTLNQYNVKCVPEMINVARAYNATLHLRPTIMTGGAIINQIERIDPTKELKRHLNDSNVKNGFYSTRKTIPEAELYGCAIRIRISVSSKGILFPCVMDRNKSLLHIRNYSQKRIVDSLKEETELFLNNHEVCKSCLINKGMENPKCGGFCRFSLSYKKGIMNRGD